MKNLLAALGIVSALATSGLIYPTAMTVTDLDYSADIVTMETSTGFVYEMYGCEDYAPGDIVALVMWSNGTDVITDDIIITARYSGYWVE